jgi:hypothetical protein
VRELNDELDRESTYSDDQEDDVSSCEDDLSAEAERPVDSNAGLKLDRAECCGEVDPEAPAASVDKAAVETWTKEFVEEKTEQAS